MIGKNLGGFKVGNSHKVNYELIVSVFSHGGHFSSSCDEMSMGQYGVSNWKSR